MRGRTRKFRWGKIGSTAVTPQQRPVGLLLVVVVLVLVQSESLESLESLEAQAGQHIGDPASLLSL